MFLVTLLFGDDAWLVTPRIGRTLGSFHYRVARQMAVMWLRRYTTCIWVYPLMKAAILTLGLEEV